jgi:hypothetical protein
MGLDGQRHVPAALFPRKRQRIHFIEGLVGLRAGLDGCGNPPSKMGFDPRTVHPVASRYTG